MIRKITQTALALTLVIGVAACSNTARGVVAGHQEQHGRRSRRH